MEATTLSEDYGPEKQQYTMSEFMEYMSSDLLIFPSSDPTDYYVFWIQEGDAGHLHPPTALPALVNSSCTSTSQEQAAIGERIKQCLQNLSSWCFWDSLLIQFWEPRIINGRRSLTTSRQPFALKTLYKGPSWYRKNCTNHDVLVDDEGADKDGLGPLGRVFLNGQPESSLDLRFYSIKEYPLRDHALRCGLRRYLALPVFELQGNCCMGVLELVSFNTELPLVYFELPRAAFEQSNLRLLHMDGQSNTQTEGRKLALSEIKQMFKVVNETPNIPLALAWVPCSQECSGNGKKCMERALYTCDSEWNKQYELIHCDFLQACLFHKLQQGKGVAGRALSSTHKLCFCRSIYGFNITEYPLAHYARKAMLAVSFAICLQSVHTGSDPYVLEFFICPGSNQEEGNPRSVIHSLLMRMMRQLLSFKVASGHKWGEELFLEILRFRMDDEPVYFQKSPSDRDRYPLEFKVSSAPESPAQAEQRSQPSDRSHQPQLEIAGGDVDPSAHEAGNTSAITSTLPRGAEETAASFERKKKNTSSQISLEDIQSRYGMPRKKAAESLDVSESTLKRLCREYNIPRWRSRTSNKANHSPCEVKSLDKPGQEAGYSGATTPSYSNPSTCSITVQDTKLVIKANYQSKTVKFPVCASSGIATLEEQVAKRLKLKIGDFEISYEDEEDQSILLTCDDDWRFYTNTLTSSGSTTIRLSVTSS